MSITGEVADNAEDELSARPTAPHPRLSPEAVVDAQLTALRCGLRHQMLLQRVLRLARVQNPRQHGTKTMSGVPALPAVLSMMLSSEAALFA